jgi:hypothetical protein
MPPHPAQEGLLHLRQERTPDSSIIVGRGSVASIAQKQKTAKKEHAA